MGRHRLSRCRGTPAAGSLARCRNPPPRRAAQPATPAPAAPDVPALATTPLAPLDPYLRECVTLEPMALSEEFARLPTDFARWNELYAAATERELQARLHEKRVRAHVTIDVRRRAAFYCQLHRVKTLTADLVDAIVEVDSRVVDAADLYTVAEGARTRLRGILSALGRKSDALVTIGANMRAERNLPPHLNTHAAPRSGPGATPPGQGTSGRG